MHIFPSKLAGPRGKLEAGGVQGWIVLQVSQLEALTNRGQMLSQSQKTLTLTKRIMFCVLKTD